jgi:hypothetical protein
MKNKRVTFSSGNGAAAADAAAPAAAPTAPAPRAPPPHPVVGILRAGRKRPAASAPDVDDANWDRGRESACDDDDDDDDGDDLGENHAVAHAASLVHDDAPGAVPVTAFNLEDELHDGVLDEAGEFVPASLAGPAAASPVHSDHGDSSDEDHIEARIRSADETRHDVDEEPDGWVDQEEETSRPAPAYGTGTALRANQASPAPAKRPRVRNGGDREYRGGSDGEAGSIADDVGTEGDDASCTFTEAELAAELSQLLENGETASGAIRRFKRSGNMAALERVTELCDGLMGLGVFNVYELQRTTVLGRTRWDLMWGPVAGDGAIHGPFIAADMMSWAASGFFSHPGKTGWVRPSHSTVQWLRASAVFNSQ